MSLTNDAFLKRIMTQDEYEELRQKPNSYLQSLAMYPNNWIQSVFVVAVNDKRFLLEKKDVNKLPSNWMTTLAKLSKQRELVNPIYLQITKDGTFLVE